MLRDNTIFPRPMCGHTGEACLPPCLSCLPAGLCAWISPQQGVCDTVQFCCPKPVTGGEAAWGPEITVSARARGLDRSQSGAEKSITSLPLSFSLPLILYPSLSLSLTLSPPLSFSFSLSLSHSLYPLPSTSAYPYPATCCSTQPLCNTGFLLVVFLDASKTNLKGRP